MSTITFKVRDDDSIAHNLSRSRSHLGVAKTITQSRYAKMF